ncbi:MAG: hypothetical protein AAF483_10135 [Planctomycetota bacterium]
MKEPTLAVAVLRGSVIPMTSNPSPIKARAVFVILRGQVTITRTVELASPCLSFLAMPPRQKLSSRSLSADNYFGLYRAEIISAMIS